MTLTEIIFWLSLAILFYCYIGYGMIVFFINILKKLGTGLKRGEKHKQEECIPLTLVVTAYNEERVLGQKIRNILELDYPADKLRVIIVTDGSVDGSADIIKRYSSITHLHQPDRKGKYAAIKRAMQVVNTPLVVFSDANSFLNRECLRRIVTHYADEKVGGVAGEKKILLRPPVSAVGQAEGLYWKYESMMKKLDARLYTVVGAAGELFSIRTSLFRELDDELILDDFVISMEVCLQGYKIEYEPGAFALESASASLAEEAKRKVRISAGAYQSISYIKESFNIFTHPVLAFQNISRRLLRWIFCPLMLAALFFTSVFLYGSDTPDHFYHWAFYVQLLFYILALIGWSFVRSGRTAGALTIPFYFVFMNYCLVKGFLKYLQGKQTVLWEKSLRQAME